MHHLIYITAAVIGYGYVLALPLEPYSGSFIVKSLPLLLLAALAWQHSHGTLRRLLVPALLASALGDAFLGIDRVAYFKPALGAFLVTQLLYAWLFWQHKVINRQRLVLASLVVAVAGGNFLIIVLPELPAKLVLPVAIYAGAIMAMAGSALLSRFHPMLAAGAVLFVCSDTLIAINQFVAPFDHATAIIVSIYLLAQLLICRALLFKPLQAPA